MVGYNTLKDLHKGKSAVLIGGGPSLMENDTLSIIKNLVKDENCLLWGVNNCLQLYEHGIEMDYVLVSDTKRHKTMIHQNLYDTPVNKALILAYNVNKDIPVCTTNNIIESALKTNRIKELPEFSSYLDTNTNEIKPFPPSICIAELLKSLLGIVLVLMTRS